MPPPSALIAAANQQVNAFPFVSLSSCPWTDIWTNRFDARLLLDILPDFDYSSTDPTNQSLLESPSGWSDLPSDTEEMFFFPPEEVADFRNEKRQQLIEQAQEGRVKARLEEEKQMLQDSVNEERWGDSDEEVSFIV